MHSPPPDCRERHVYNSCDPHGQFMVPTPAIPTVSFRAFLGSMGASATAAMLPTAPLQDANPFWSINAGLGILQSAAIGVTVVPSLYFPVAVN